MPLMEKSSIYEKIAKLEETVRNQAMCELDAESHISKETNAQLDMVTKIKFMIADEPVAESASEVSGGAGDPETAVSATDQVKEIIAAHNRMIEAIQNADISCNLFRGMELWHKVACEGAAIVDMARAAKIDALVNMQSGVITVRENCSAEPLSDTHCGLGQKESPVQNDREREFEYLTIFVRETGPEIDEEPFKEQLRSLWTAYCLHYGLCVDTQTYDADIFVLWEEVCHSLDDQASSWPDFSAFDNYMCERIV